MTTPTVVLPTAVTVQYSMPFICIVTRFKEGKKLSSTSVSNALNEWREEYLWWEFLGWMMRDTLEDMHKMDSGKKVYLDKSPSVENVKVTIDSNPVSELDEADLDEDTHDEKEFEGTVTWESVDVREKELEEARAWRIGDRMAYYGVNDDSRIWYTHIKPGKIERSVIVKVSSE